MGHLEIKNLKVHYPIKSDFLFKKKSLAAVDGISLLMEEGKNYGLVGGIRVRQVHSRKSDCRVGADHCRSNHL